MADVEKASPGKIARRYGLLFGATGFIVGAVVEMKAMLSSLSSTAALGLFALPYVVVIVWVLPSAIAGVCVGYLYGRRRASSLSLDPSTAIASITAMLLILGSVYFFGDGVYLSAKVDRVAQMNAAEIQ